MMSLTNSPQVPALGCPAQAHTHLSVHADVPLGNMAQNRKAQIHMSTTQSKQPEVMSS